ncbi:hypothetical protein SALBM311S_01584 [Streptomyces alboniger]
MAAARDAECPVVVVPRPGREVHGEARREPGPRAVVGLQVDSPDEATLAFAFTEAVLRDARCRCRGRRCLAGADLGGPRRPVPPTIDQAAVELVPAPSLRVSSPRTGPCTLMCGPSRNAAPGDAAGHLVAASKNADLVVVGRHRRRLLAPARTPWGPSPTQSRRTAASPVAVVPPAPPEI